MFEIKRCPVCAAETGLEPLGEHENSIKEFPENIMQAGINAALILVAKRKQITTVTMMCNSCHHFFITPTFDDDEISVFYSEAMFELTRKEYRKSESLSGKSWAVQHGMKQSNQSRLLEDGHKLRQKLLFEFVLDNADGRASGPRRIIDIGGMDGALMSHFKAERYVYDLNPKPDSESGVRFLSDVSEVARAGKFDLMIMSHVLEHEPDPLGFVSRFLSCVDEGGGVYFEVPLEYQAAYVRKRGFSIGGHVNFFTASSLLRLALESGLQVKKMKRDIFPYGEMRIPILKMFAEKRSFAQEKPKNPKLDFYMNLCYDLFLLMKYRYVRGR